eukprot:scaffold105952_cov33-Tisochrysis_lutea.AAC.2
MDMQPPRVAPPASMRSCQLASACVSLPAISSLPGMRGCTALVCSHGAPAGCSSGDEHIPAPSTLRDRPGSDEPS